MAPTNQTDPKLSSPSADSDAAIVQSFVDSMTSQEKRSLQWELQSFVIRHASHHRPIALVSSGGTAADLEVHSVRCLENFSTGTRGAIAVEEFLRRGYAVIHLWRTGSASPYGRLVSQGIGIQAPNHGITMASLGKLFNTGDIEEDQEDQMVQSVLDDAHKNDPWLSDAKFATPRNNTTSTSNNNNNNKVGGGVVTPKKSNAQKKAKDPLSGSNSLHLYCRIANSETIRTALQERQAALEDERILTIPYRSVEEYLAKLQLSSQALRDNQALAIFFLAAAVSDFYIPPSLRSTHKIQSGGGMERKDGMTLRLSPVPKVMGLIRSIWAPDAFVCSFKLETDRDILRKKAESAVEKYGCHMVIGNLLETRHSQVWILCPSDLQSHIHATATETVQQWPMQEISKPKSSENDALEAMIMDHVVQAHFEYISASSSGSFDKSGTAAVLKAHQELDRKRKEMEREAFWKKMKVHALEWAGVALGAALSYMVSTALRRRMNT
ncbi:DNA/pantothenate metabolism flavoprotein [Nitzschia inconspicua]|uniref:DNA/pantothenate metabolism flavoprotein n=1 Tax=Nitzschia inconspicua TaxID=303405 RepID=A0A9K3LDQ3_9STRA|nr:DNA/pantothenate metabolism flavoprotein [Nitzschia inconspicua]